MKTVKAIRRTIPPSVLVGATETIDQVGEMSSVDTEAVSGRSGALVKQWSFPDVTF
jgi:hypothetical protein